MRGGNVVEAANGALFEGDGHTRHPADQAHHRGRDPRNQRDLYPLWEREAEGVRYSPAGALLELGTREF